MDNETSNSSLHSAMVTFPKPMVHRDCHIANGIPASRVLDLDNQSRFGVTSAFLRANSPAVGLHPSSAAQKESRNTGHTAQKRRRSLHQTNLHAAKPSLYLVTLAYTKSRLTAAKCSCRNTMCRMSPASNYCAVLTLRIILRMFPPFACLTSFISAPTLAFPATPADAFDMCSDAYAAGPRTVLRPLISDVH